MTNPVPRTTWAGNPGPVALEQLSSHTAHTTTTTCHHYAQDKSSICVFSPVTRESRENSVCLSSVPRTQFPVISPNTAHNVSSAKANFHRLSLFLQQFSTHTLYTITREFCSLIDLVFLPTELTKPLTEVRRLHGRPGLASYQLVCPLALGLACHLVTLSSMTRIL